jgi:hypothetical protein
MTRIPKDGHKLGVILSENALLENHNPIPFHSHRDRAFDLDKRSPFSLTSQALVMNVREHGKMW